MKKHVAKEPRQKEWGLMCLFFSVLLAGSGHAQTIERIQFSGFSFDNASIQAVGGTPFGRHLSNTNGSLTVGTEYGKSTFVPLQVKMEMGTPANLLVYPNPFREEVHIEWKGWVRSDQILLLLDPTGKEVRKISFQSGQMNLNLSDVASGIYTLQLREGNRLQGAVKISKSN
jgi:hypothetical protein